MPYAKMTSMGDLLKEVWPKKKPKAKNPAKVGKVMAEFKAGTLHSSSGEKVTNRRQAIAIGLSEAGMAKKKK